jgi:predicted Rossmann fold flavoprotein
VVSIAIIGGGAAGLTAAIVAARAGAQVTLFEADERVGTKILKTGNGRCNLSNLHVSPTDYNNPMFMEEVFKALPPARVRAFFNDLGLLTCQEEDRIYPQTNKANSVLDVLRLALVESGVESCLREPVISVAHEPSEQKAQEFLVATTQRSIHVDKVIVATGGAYRWSLPVLQGCLGAVHPWVSQEPVLRSLRVEHSAIKGCAGVRVRCQIKLYESSPAKVEENSSERTTVDVPVATETGELQFKDDSVSGIMIFDLSRYVRAGMMLAVDFFPEYAHEEFLAMLQRRIQQFRERTARDFFVGLLHKQIAQVVLNRLNISPDEPALSLDTSALFRQLKQYLIPVIGGGDSRQAQVMRGGFSTSVFDPLTLQSRNNAGFFVVGEALDVDGRCGGYNLHWAWTSGILAGAEAAKQ